jgi:hypothetical protein
VPASAKAPVLPSAASAPELSGFPVLAPGRHFYSHKGVRESSEILEMGAWQPSGK